MDIERAIQIAVAAHAGAKDKGGNPYILHPMNVMSRVDTDDEKIVAILHDVVEDTDWTFGALRKEGFSETVLEALAGVTKVTEEEDYDLFIDRCAKNPISTKVKIADLIENLDVTRIEELTENDVNRLMKYKKALLKLRNV